MDPRGGDFSRKSYAMKSGRADLKMHQGSMQVCEHNHIHKRMTLNHQNE